MDNPSDFLKFAIKIAKEAGKIQMSYFENYGSVSKKRYRPAWTGSKAS